MATTFVIRIHHDDQKYARQAAMAAFRECAALEAELSRFIESSSITRINRAATGQFVAVHPDAYLCLQQALQISEACDGAFDVGYRSSDGKATTGWEPPVILSPEAVQAAPARPSPDLDLGGIGKGYAIDKMAEVLRVWSIGQAIIMGGWSTLLAVGTPPGQAGWSINLPGYSGGEHLLPDGWSVSASGFTVKGAHILDPKSGKEARGAVRTWSLAQSAALSDALSTAFMVMDRPAIQQFVNAYPGCGAALLCEDQCTEFIGQTFPKAENPA